MTAWWMTGGLQRFLVLGRRRAIQGFLVMIVVISFNFVLIQLAPGDPVDVLAGESGAASEESLKAIRAHFGLDRPMHEQYLIYARNILSLDLGYSYHDNASVLELILSRLNATFILMFASLAGALLIGMLLGVISARRVNGPTDVTVSVIALLAYATPLFWSGLMLIVLFSVRLQIFPINGMETPGAGYGSFQRALDILWHLALPATALGLFYVALYTRLMRSSILEVAQLDFVRTARAKGMPEMRVQIRHILRNALLPLVTMVGVQIGAVLGGSVVIESTFGWPGLGRLAFEAVGRRDQNLLLGILLFSSILVVFVNFLVDMLYATLDPRIEAQH